MKVWLVVVAFLICACSGLEDFALKVAGGGSGEVENAVAESDSRDVADVEVQLAVVSDDSELAAEIEALEKQLLERQAELRKRISELEKLTITLQGDIAKVESNMGRSLSLKRDLLGFDGSTYQLERCVSSLVYNIKSSLVGLSIDHTNYGSYQSHTSRYRGGSDVEPDIYLPSSCQ